MRVMPKDPAEQTDKEKAIVAQIQTVFDPEIPVNIYELGLIYEIRTDDEGLAEVDMTLTSPMCPAAEQIPPEVQQKVSSAAGITHCDVKVVWEPPWTPALMSEAAKTTLNLPY